MRKLTTTSYAVLGLLAIRPWSTYELAQQVSKSLKSWWPRTERQLYEQPKILVEHGLATATTELVGRRRRTVYDITPEGRDALRGWLDQPSSVYAWEWDAILRVFFADHGTKEQLLATLGETAAKLGAANAGDLALLEEVSQPGYRYADRVHLFALILKLEESVFAAIDDWFEWAVREVQSWPDITGPEDRLAFFERVLSDVNPD
jgi:PadR family transcriptional regulator AphA